MPKSMTTLSLGTKSPVESQKVNEAKSSSCPNTRVSVQEIEMPLDQLHRGQVLEIQAPDTAALLNSDGQLSKEVLEILHQAGFQLQNDQVTIDTSGIELSGTTMELHLEGALEETVNAKKQIGDEEVLNHGTQLDAASGLVYLPSASDEDHKDDSKDEKLPSIVSVFGSGVLPNSQLDLESLSLVEDVLVEKTHESCSSTQVIGSSILQDGVEVEVSNDQVGSVLDIPGLDNDLTEIEKLSGKSESVVVESADKSYILPSMSIDNIIEVGSTELVISGEEVQVDNAIMTGGILVAHNEFTKNSPMDFM